MNSIGNDIVALAGIQPERTCRYRFYSKILSLSEQEYFHSLPAGQLPFEHYVWLLWSVKESAYKFIKRLQPEFVFPPTKIIVQHIKVPEHSSDNYSGMVHYQDVSLAFQSGMTTQYIHTLTDVQEHLPRCISGVQQIDNSNNAVQSAAVRQAALLHFKILLPEHDLTIRKNSVGYPELWNNDVPLNNIPLSFSHDGNFVAYAFKTTGDMTQLNEQQQIADYGKGCGVG